MQSRIKIKVRGLFDWKIVYCKPELLDTNVALLRQYGYIVIVG